MSEEKETRPGELNVTDPGTIALDDEQNREDPETRLGGSEFGPRMNLILSPRGTAEMFVFDADSITELSIGRYDPENNIMPDVDLTAFDAVEKGVSRQHATIIREAGMLKVKDHKSPNGTFLNGQRLIPNQTRVLRNGDDLRLGYLVLHVRYEKILTDRLRHNGSSGS